jgi:hypothetical protein
MLGLSELVQSAIQTSSFALYPEYFLNRQVLSVHPNGAIVSSSLINEVGLAAILPESEQESAFKVSLEKSVG